MSNPPDVIWVIQRFWDNEDKTGWFTGTVEDKSEDDRWHKYHRAPEWVSVEERLPTAEEVERDNGWFFVFAKGRRGKDMELYDENGFLDDVEYWMPLPPSPSDEV